MEGGTESVEWVREELCGVGLADERLNRCLIKTAELLGKSPASPSNETCGDWAITQAAYRLLDNAKQEPEGQSPGQPFLNTKRKTAERTFNQARESTGYGEIVALGLGIRPHPRETDAEKHGPKFGNGIFLHPHPPGAGVP